jgi:transmembrane sensor
VTGHRLANGSTVVARDRATFEVVENTRERSVVRLTGGTIDVTGSPATTPSPLTILSHRVTVRVFAPSMWVSHSEVATEVFPLRGHLEVEAGGKVHRVEAGEHATFPRDPSTPAQPPEAKTNVTAPAPAPGATKADNDDSAPKSDAKPKSKKTTRAPAAEADKADKPRAPKSWRKLARAGEFDRAYEALAARGLHSVRDRVGDLLLAADVARLSRHPRDAVRPLTRIVTGFSSDPRAALAAFTLGRVQLYDLRLPTAAARTFRKARLLRPSGPLADDALAREVEAWARAGKPDLAKLRGREYLKRYPRGHHLRAVKKYAGL